MSFSTNVLFGLSKWRQILSARQRNTKLFAYVGDVFALQGVIRLEAGHGIFKRCNAGQHIRGFRPAWRVGNQRLQVWLAAQQMRPALLPGPWHAG